MKKILKITGAVVAALFVLLLVLPFALMADLLQTDYRAWGIMSIALFLLLKPAGKQGFLLCIALLLLNWSMPSMVLPSGN